MVYHIGTKHFLTEKGRKKFIKDLYETGFEGKFIRTAKVFSELRFKPFKFMRIKISSKMDIWEIKELEGAKYTGFMVWNTFPHISFIKEGVLHY